MSQGFTWIDWWILIRSYSLVSYTRSWVSMLPPFYLLFRAFSLHHERRFTYLFFGGNSDWLGAKNSWAKGSQHSCLCFPFALAHPGFGSYSLFIIPFVIYKNTSLTSIHRRLYALHSKRAQREKIQRKWKQFSQSLCRKCRQRLFGKLKHSKLIFKKK